MDASILLRATQAKYSQCLSYEDSGQLEAFHAVDGKEPSVEIARFKTIFIRPSLLRFDFKRQTSTHELLLQADGDSVILRLSHDLQEKFVQSFPTLEKAVAASQGMSLLSLPIVYGFLSKDRFGFSEFKNASRANDTRIGDSPCYELTGNWGALESKIWISRDTNTVKQVSAERSLTIENAIENYESAKQICELQGMEFNYPEPRPSSMRIKLTFDSVTFNNSITVDAIG